MVRAYIAARMSVGLGAQEEGPGHVTKDDTENKNNNNRIQSRRRKDMLILTRRVGETLMIGDDVAVTVLGVKGNQVRIGVNAPRHVAVHREEIYERIRREREQHEVAGSE